MTMASHTSLAWVTAVTAVRSGTAHGDSPLKVTEKMPKWEALQGKMLMDRWHDIKYTWLLFDGDLPRVVEDITGDRISFVFFTRKG